MIDLMFDGIEGELTFRLDQKLVAEERSWCRIGPFHLSLSRGEAMELLFPDDRSLAAVMEILTLRDMNWIGSLRIGDFNIDGADVVPPEQRPWVFSSLPIHESSVTAVVLERFAIRHGFSGLGDSRSVRRLAEQFDLASSLETRVQHLNSVERQLLQCAVLHMTRPSILLIDGREPLLPAVRPKASALFSRLVDSTAIMVLKLIGSNNWSGLSAIRSHPPVQSIPYEWGHNFRERRSEPGSGRYSSANSVPL